MISSHDPAAPLLGAVINSLRRARHLEAGAHARERKPQADTGGGEATIGIIAESGAEVG